MIEPSDVIDIGLWNRAQWSGVLFKVQPGTLPVFALVFRDLDAGEEILKGWRDALGNHDRNEVIRVSVIEGNIPGTPPGYSVHIGPDQTRAIESAKAKGEGPIIMCASRHASDGTGAGFAGSRGVQATVRTRRPIRAHGCGLDGWRATPGPGPQDHQSDDRVSAGVGDPRGSGP